MRGTYLFRLESDMEATPTLLQECVDKIGDGYGSGGAVTGSIGNGGGFYVQTRVLGASDYQFTTGLERGMRDEDAMELQKRLRTRRFFTFQTNTDYFSPYTEAAVRAYQQAYGLPVTGKLDEATRDTLNGNATFTAKALKGETEEQTMSRLMTILESLMNRAKHFLGQ